MTMLILKVAKMRCFFKYIITSFFIVIIPANLFAQIAERLNYKGFKNTSINRIEYSNKKTSFFMKKKYRKGNKVIYFKFSNGQDSVSVYLNDSLIFSQYINSMSERFHESRFEIPIPFKKEADTIIISLNNRKKYIKFKVRKKYFSVWVGYEFDDNYWIMVQNNNLPAE